jgi:transposase
MRRHEIKDADWQRIQHLLPGQEGQPGVTAKDNRLFINAVLWIAKTGAPWRDLPERFGNWNSVWKRFDRWCRKGVWQRIADALQDPELKQLILDSTIIRAHQHAAGAHGGPEKEALGRSRGGFSTKIHVAANQAGKPCRFILTPGQQADISQGEALISGFNPENVITDKGYDSDKFVGTIEGTGAVPVIPPRANRKEPRDFDKDLYKDRNVVERLWNRMKQFRRVATRYEKTGRNFLGFVLVAAIMILVN